MRTISMQQRFACPKCKMTLALSVASLWARCPKCANSIRVPAQPRPPVAKARAARRTPLWLFGLAAVCMAGGIGAWKLHDQGAAPPDEPQVAAVTSPADTTAPGKQEVRSEPPATARTEPATAPKETAPPATRPEQPPPTKVAPPPDPVGPPAPLVGPPAPLVGSPPPTPKDPPKVTPPAFTYWLARKPDPAQQEYIFDVRVPADVAAMIVCSEPPYARFQASVQKLDWISKGTKYVLLTNRLAWKGDDIERGKVGLAALGGRNDKAVAIADPDWSACKEQFLAQAVASGDLRTVAAIVVKVDGTAKPDLRVRLGDGPAGRPTTKPHIVAVAQKGQLYVCWQAASGPAAKIRVHKIGLDQLEQGSLTAVRDVDSLGTLVGFTVDEAGTDYVLTAKTEDLANSPMGKFVDDIHKTWRKDVLVLYRNGKATDLNNEKFSGWPLYGVTNAGTGRLAVSGTHLAATFARRQYTPKDNLIHQMASDLIVSRDLAQVAIKAGNVVSHSFGQRLIVDGTDFITLQAGDSYPYAGLIIEKIAKKSGTARFNAFSCPTNGNAIFFDLGGVAAEADGYPILFTAPRNTASATDGSLAQVRRLPYELALVYVVRNFETKRAAKSPYDIISSGILAGGYAPDEEFTADNMAWNAESSRFDKKETRTFRRRVLWLTEHDQPGGASNAKLVKLRDGQYVALWTENGRGTRTMVLTIKGPASAKSITKGEPVDLKGVPLPLGDDAVALRINDAPQAAWITSNGQVLLHTLDAELAYKAYPLNLP
jgi:hypothetical protein